MEKEIENNKNRLSQPPSLTQDILQLFIKIGIIIVVFVLLFTFLFGIFRNTDHDMTPAVKDGDLVIFYRLDKQYVLSDSVVVEYKGNKGVRRVVAVAGDEVDITSEGLFVNGALQQEADIYEDTIRYEGEIDFPITVEEGQVFLLGDCRESATDSRVYGAVDIKDTLGKVTVIIRRRGI